jgi:phosphoserine phosphatase RsbU/P
MSLMPTVRGAAAGPAASAWLIDALSRPATEFTGDFYFALETPSGLWFAVGDFAGHGLHAAVFMAMIQEQLEWAVDECNSNDPAEVVATIDRFLRDEIPLNRFATLVIGKAAADGSMLVVNAGHCPPIVARRSGAIEVIGSHGPIVGRLACPEWAQQQIELDSGDRLILYTDGVVERENELGEELGVARLMDAIRGAPDASAVELDAAISGFAAGAQCDDVTLMILRRVGPALLVGDEVE